MSRYFAIRVTDPKTNQILVPNLNGKPGFSRVPFSPLVFSYSSLYQGGSPTRLASNNANALRVTFDIPTGFLDAPLANAYFRIYGVSLQEISQGANLNGMNVAIYGGMAKGLPLANPAQIGPLCQGQILQCFGNWVGTSQTLDMYIQAGGSSPASNQVTGSVVTSSTLPAPTTNQNPAGIVFQWQPGQHLTDALVPCIQNVYPQYSVLGTLHQGLVWTGTAVTAVFGKLSQLAGYVRRASINLIGGYAPDTAAYMGVRMSLWNNSIVLQDGTTPTTAKTIYAVDLIGQPTYSEPLEIQVTCTLRGDIKVGAYVTIPQGQLTIGTGAQVGYVPPPPVESINTAKNNIAFQGSYLVTAVRHVGDSRNPSGLAWVTTIDVLTTQPYDANAAVYAQKVLAGQNKSAYQFFIPS
ncbi:hypothetical protein ACFQ3P_13770 [Paraburkholderia sabiae]|uniref:Uncharacterized protein n=1 Tax=Paraburkholderia sabiae TaxID=273251 RepID=A0ABU9QD39_9BURK|nr:hypothetical protein [Paraburkholderia sabiae]WJZ76167.1 hypothetical protein QEN71_10310 [Paraburkholderia sabiae]CAD6525997.1 hypothetical protein LMG24235_01907 [Paraburkholderia sabiae]